MDVVAWAGEKGMKVVLAAFVILVALVCALSLLLARFVMNGKRPTIEEAWEWQSARYDTSFYEGLQKTDYLVAGYDGYGLHVQLLTNSNPSDRYVILTHGNTDNHIGSLKSVRMYLDLGFNCIVYDRRGHGEDEPTFCTYGDLEGKDLVELVKDTRERFPQLAQLGLHGESLGASTTIEALAYAPEVDFVVSDCAFADVESVLRLQLSSRHAPWFLVPLANAGIRVLYDRSIYDMRPIDALDKSTVPILFIQGDADTMVPPQSARELYDRATGVRELHYVA
ncbi:MAG: alpha/beta fold hydrolase, partial [Atopobiaceae bacterium]|nr:alpha/beta fold hydrolase [Atopobiaceae bacterium]